jgi:hypothetical protein
MERRDGETKCGVDKRRIGGGNRLHQLREVLKTEHDRVNRMGSRDKMRDLIACETDAVSYAVQHRSASRAYLVLYICRLITNLCSGFSPTRGFFIFLIQ